MRMSKQRLVTTLLLIALLFFGATYQLPYYIYKPGNADALDPIVLVESGYQSEGDMHLVTVSGLRATPIHYVLAKLIKYNEVLPLESVRPEGVSDAEYLQAQLHMMEGSQQASVIVAYEAAGKEVDIKYNGIYVMAVVEGMPAEGILRAGDRITQIDDKDIKEADDLITYIDTKLAGEVVTLQITRDKMLFTEEIVLKAFAEAEDKVGLGIQLVTDRQIEVSPDVQFSSGKIGGPSAGLMFALEIYDQLTEQDLTHGRKIIGTGALDYQGNVERISGVDKKVIAADKAGGDIFFVPFENGAADSNYNVAKETAEAIKTEMQIVPVDTFAEAVTFLENLK